MLIDTHCHIDAPEFDADREQVIAAAKAAGVSAIIVPAVSIATLESTRTVCAVHPGWAYPAYGLHPVYVNTHRREDISTLKDWLRQNPAVAVGEIGLDGFVEGLSMSEQEWFFVEQLKLAREFDLPVVLHVRRALDTVLKHLRRIKVKGGIAHAFNGSPQQAEAFIQQGFKLGFGGAMTYPRALNIRRLASSLPLESIVLETDSPDIQPEWDSQGRNTPEYLPQIAAVLAELRGIAIDVAVAATSLNATRVLACSDGSVTPNISPFSSKSRFSLP